MSATLADPSNFGNKPGDGPLKPGGQPGTIPERDANLPSTLSAATKRQLPALKIVRDVSGGNESVRDCKEIYLPPDPGEEADDYFERLKRAVFFNVFKKTVEGLTGFVFAKDPIIGDDVPALIKTQLENIDNAGTHFDVFAHDIFEDAFTSGHAGILVDFPATGGTQSAAAEQTTIRPYWVPIKKDNIVSWRTAVVDGKTFTTQLVIRECAMLPDGAFGEVETITYRVLYNDLDTGVVGVKVLRITEDKKVILVSEGLYPTQNEIPFAEIVTSGRKSFLESAPPLIDLAYLNIAHYQMWSDRATSIHKTCVPIWVESGVNPRAGAELTLGPNNARQFPDPNAKAGYQSHDGAALGEVTKVIEELKSDMAVLGLAMLAPSKRAAETAEAKRIDKAATDSQLGVSARGLQDGLERGLYFHARYLKLPDGGSVTINRDFEAMIMDAATMTAYATLAEKLNIPVRVILEELQLGGRIREDVNLDDLESQIAAIAAANAAQQEIEDQAALDAKVAEKTKVA